MWLCECGAGGGHYDQSTPILGKLYRKGGRVEELEPESDCTDTEIESEVEEIAELALPTFATLEVVRELPRCKDAGGNQQNALAPFIHEGSLAVSLFCLPHPEPELARRKRG